MTTKPLYFYKFVSFDRKDILENGLIRFAPIGSFNDPFELEPSITPISRRFTQYCSDLTEAELNNLSFSEEDYSFSEKRADQVEAFREIYRAKIGKYGVLSLSSNNKINQLLSVSAAENKDPKTNLLMWSHYADSHKGFVIEFCADFIEGINIEKVEYSKTRKTLTFEDIENENFYRVFHKKSSEWEYEQEYRAILPLKDACKTIEIRGEKLHLFKINKKKVHSLTFGCAMKDAEKDIIKNLVANDPDLEQIPLHHAQLNDSDFLLSFYSDYGEWTNNPLFEGRHIQIQKKI
jgi:hypothetical protein